MDRHALRLPVAKVDVLGPRRGSMSPGVADVVSGPRDCLCRAISGLAAGARPGFVRLFPIGSPVIARSALVPNDLVRRFVEILPESAVLARAVLAAVVCLTRCVEASPLATGAGLWVLARSQGRILSSPVGERVTELQAEWRKSGPHGSVRRLHNDLRFSCGRPCCRHTNAILPSRPRGRQPGLRSAALKARQLQTAG